VVGTLLDDGIPNDVASQVGSMVAEAVDRALRALLANGGGVPTQRTGYALPARTAEEVKRDPAASSGHVSRARAGQVERVMRAQGMDAMELAKASKKSEIADPASQGESKAEDVEGYSTWLL
jgi:hypothetical protein